MNFKKYTKKAMIVISINKRCSQNGAATSGSKKKNWDNDVMKRDVKKKKLNAILSNRV